MPLPLERTQAEPRLQAQTGQVKRLGFVQPWGALLLPPLPPGDPALNHPHTPTAGVMSNSVTQTPTLLISST